MSRKTSGYMVGERYCGDVRTRVVHDLDNEKSGCQIAEIMRTGNDKPFNYLETATAAGFSPCPGCLGSGK
jgi:hypothetical protein